MRKQCSAQYTLRAVPPVEDKALGRKAQREGKSLNEAALEILSIGLCLAGEPPLKRDWDFLGGTWFEDPQFDAALQERAESIHIFGNENRDGVAGARPSL